MTQQEIQARQLEILAQVDGIPAGQINDALIRELAELNDMRRQATPATTAPSQIYSTKFLRLRETTFAEYIGQQRHVERVKDAIRTAQKTNKPLPHMAFISRAGSGKTTLAACIASELGGEAWSTTGSALDSLDSVAEFVQAVGKHGIAFIDEAHDLAKANMPIVSGLLPLLEDWKMHTSTSAYEVEPFTCIMATTDYGMLNKALRSRMGIPYQFDPYTPEELAKIARVHSLKKNMALTEDAALEIGKRARGNPRYCLNLMSECNNIAVANDTYLITPDVCDKAFDRLQIDSNGLTLQDRDLLCLLANGAVAMSRCAGTLGLDTKTYKETVEDYLFQQGLITINSKGRGLTEKGEKLTGGF